VRSLVNDSQTFQFEEEAVSCRLTLPTWTCWRRRTRSHSMSTWRSSTSGYNAFLGDLDTLRRTDERMPAFLD
jgi:hypothetical protein